MSDKATISKFTAKEVVKQYERLSEEHNAETAIFLLGAKVLGVLNSEEIGAIVLSEARRVLAKGKK